MLGQFDDILIGKRRYQGSRRIYTKLGGNYPGGVIHPWAVAVVCFAHGKCARNRRRSDANNRREAGHHLLERLHCVSEDQVGSPRAVGTSAKARLRFPCSLIKVRRQAYGVHLRDVHVYAVEHGIS
jgi:hypothetical protein